MDRDRVCDADGYPSDKFFLYLAQWLRRARGENWFALIGIISGDRSSFLIGTDRTLIAPASGVLTCFANDVLFMYGNNTGFVELIITRTE